MIQPVGQQKSRRDSIKGDIGGVSHGSGGGARLVLGMFTIFPASGVVLPNNSTTVTVDMFSEIALAGEEEFLLDISERSPTDNPGGIEYRLLGEACLPSIINLQTGLSSIFEEHRIVRNLSVFRNHSQDLLPGSGVYGEDENRFVFCNVIVGHKAKARFKITNPNKVSCDVMLALKPLSNKPMHRISEIYDVEPQRASIQAHSSIHATVTFHPPSMQQYPCIFEATVDGIPVTVTKGRNLTFDIQGDGNLPRLAVTQPISTNSKGHPVMIFNRLLVGRSQVSQLALKNDGTLPCTVTMSLVDPNNSFTVSKFVDMGVESNENDTEIDEEEHFHLATTCTKPVSKNFKLAVNESIRFIVDFCPKHESKLSAEIRLSIMDNPFEDTTVILIGEGYAEEVTLDNIRPQKTIIADEQIDIEDKNFAVPSGNHITFGDCEIGVADTATFTISNHSNTDTVRFCWEPLPEVTFSPAVGHLRPNCAKDVTMTFLSEKPLKMNATKIACKTSKIDLQGDGKVHDWDSRKRTVKWIDVTPEPSASLVLDPDGNAHSVISQKPGMKKKVIETEPEPQFQVLPGSESSLILLCTACAGYGNYQCSVDRIYFKDTFMFQTRVYSFTLKNPGDVQLRYDWNIKTGIYHPPSVSPDEEEMTEAEKGKQSRNSRKASSKVSTTPNSSRQNTMSQAKGNRAQAASKAESGRKSKTALQDSANEVPIDSVRSGSKMGRMIDGRPASVMTLAYEAGGAYNELVGSDDLPFSIEPETGVIAAGEEASFTVRFSPVDIVNCNAILSASISNMEPGSDPPMIALHGQSLLPWCHFDLDESDYISERRNPELRGPNGAPAGSMLDPMTKVLEFKACGIDTKVVQKFFILNPTDTAYMFNWQQESNDATNINRVNTDFTCLTPKGSISPGKKIEIVFEYSAESLELTESFWRFFINDHNVSVPFLLVGHGSTPSVSFDHSHVNFKELLLGHTAKKTIYILNDEDQPFTFKFDEASRHAAGHIASLDIDCMKGSVPPRSKLPITISYKAETELEVNFNVVCHVKRKTTPLTLNVKAEGFSVNMSLICEDSTGSKVNLTPKGINMINFNNVELNEKAVRQLFIENNGRFNLDFTWSLSGPSKPKDQKEVWPSSNPPVTVLPLSGSVVPTSRRRCQLSFCPPCKVMLKNCILTLKIVNGPTYQIAVTGNGITPVLDFSFTSHNFGPCFIHRPGLAIQKTTLLVKNRDTKDISLECQYSNTRHLEVVATTNVLKPDDTKEIQLLFYPRELKTYHERVPFEINGLSVTHVDVYGVGTEMNVEVANAADRKVNLGALQIGQKINKLVRVVNNSLASIDFSLSVTPSFPILQDNNVLSVAPVGIIHLKPKATIDVVVHFQPKCRVPKFFEEVILECAGVSQPLFTIIGSCQGLEIRLDSEAIPFGSVTLGSSSSRKLMMTNSGDIGAAFAWNIERFQPAFNIIPVKGYISPGMEVPFEIQFKPQKLDQDIRYDDLRCSLEGGKPLKLTLTGSCIAQMPMKEVIQFITHVRNRDVKTVAVHNKTNQVWTLRPVIDGEYWSGTDTFIIEPQQSKNYELIYRPLTMTQDNKKHNGSVFFALPDGTGLLYVLGGQADPPKPIGNLQKDVPCKTSYTEVLTVSNWLRKPQRFRVIMELVKPEKPDPATSFKGLDYLDVPGLSKKDYKVHFYAHKEGTFSCKVTFKNEQSGEYQYYYVTFKASGPGTIASIDLTTPVRQSTSHVITINNPLVSMVNFQTNCNIQDVNLPPQFTVPPQSEGSCTFEYIPLKSGSATGRLVLQSIELGSYIYDLNLTATPAAPERAVHFISTLGTSQIQSCKFMNYSRTRVEYSCRVDNPDFMVDKTINAASAASGGSEVNIDVTFEPSRLGDAKATLVVTSPVGGEYTFPLIGHCLPPKPQGPYTVKAGSNTQIPFKNIFSQTTTFSFHADNPCFTVKSGETIRAKKTHNIVVGFDGNQGDSKAVRMGRFVVTCARSAGTGSNISWTFYLKGVTP